MYLQSARSHGSSTSELCHLMRETGRAVMCKGPLVCVTTKTAAVCAGLLL